MVLYFAIVSLSHCKILGSICDSDIQEACGHSGTGKPYRKMLTGDTSVALACAESFPGNMVERA